MITGFGLVKKPRDPAKFEDHFWRVHIPLVKRMPGLRKSVVHRVTSSRDPDFFLVVELGFDNMEAVRNAASSPEGSAVGDDRRKLLADTGAEMSIFWCETKEA